MKAPRLSVLAQGSLEQILDNPISHAITLRPSEGLLRIEPEALSSGRSLSVDGCGPGPRRAPPLVRLTSSTIASTAHQPCGALDTLRALK